MPSDKDLVDAFLGATDGLTQGEVEQAVDGVTQNDVSRWRRGEWKRLTGEKRRALSRFVEAGGVVNLVPVTQEELRGLEDLLGMAMRVMQAEAEAAQARARGIEKEAEAARLRAEMIHRIETLRTDKPAA